MGERSREQAADVDLPDPVPALSGEQGVAFDEAQRILCTAAWCARSICAAMYESATAHNVNNDLTVGEVRS